MQKYFLPKSIRERVSRASQISFDTRATSPSKCSLNLVNSGHLHGHTSANRRSLVALGIGSSANYDDTPKSIPNTNSSEFSYALCILPPEKDWDRLQRARHFAMDPLFHEWPPAIRLFHPFLPPSLTSSMISSTAPLEVAQVIEDLEVEPFEITLDQWVIIPHVEKIQSQWLNLESAPEEDDDGKDSIFDEEDLAVQALIESEERKGREKLLARQLKEKLKEEEMGGKSRRGPAASKTASRGPEANTGNGGRPKMSPESKKSPAEVLAEQQKQYEDFGGPCILCLEPDEESKEKLCDLRDALREGLDHSGYSSPSSLYSWDFVRQEYDQNGNNFRPLIPISSFESIQAALDIARRLKGLWGEPLTFTATELDLISCRDDSEAEWEQSSTIQTSAEWNQVPWGCNAKIKLMGEEDTIGDDDESTILEIGEEQFSIREMVQKLVEEGEPGGMDISSDFTILEDEEEEPKSSIEEWLDDDEGFDEGTVVKIGRTHFFTGDQRIFRGMPATSAVDAKDRSMGAGGNGSVSGLARRRRTSSRQGAMWEDGEYGRRDKDYLPWNKRQIPTKKLMGNERLLSKFYSTQGDGDVDDSDD